MRLNLTQENLNKALGVAGRIVSSRVTLPVLSNVLLATEDKRLKISATNLELGINYWVGCKVEEEGAVTIPARLFGEYISSLPSGNIELSSDEAILKVKSPHYESNINGISAEEFPLIPKIDSQPVLSLPADSLREALAQVVICASLDEARPVLAGVYFYIEDKQLVLVATDSYRLAERKLKLKNAPKEKLSVIVPVRTIQELVRILGDVDGQLNVYLSENQVMFEIESIQLTSRLIEGTFPNYRQIIPGESETDVDIDTNEFSRVTKVASLFARENAGSIRLEIKPENNTLNIMSTASEVGENTSTADCDVAGPENEISLNSRYLSEALGVIKTKQLQFCVSGKLNPCLIRPMGKDADDYLHIIMPLRT